MTIRSAVLLAGLLATAAPLSAPEAPLSAIDWLSESVEQPDVIAAAPTANQAARGTQGTAATRTPPADETPITDSATTPNVTVQTLGGPAPKTLGLLPPETTGLPANLWSGSDVGTLSTLLMAEQIDTLPALQDLIITLAIAQADPALGDPSNTAFLLARVDKLLAFGALEPAQAMLEAANTQDPQVFRRLFDVSLLTGTENSACRTLKSTPDVAPTPSARIFCLARSGDWSAAALTLNTGQALGDIQDDTAALLSRFLDTELFEGEPDLTRPDPVTPLTFRMFEAIGEPLTTRNLPRAFSHADLRSNVGWKAQLEAAERLARSGAISQNALVGLYSDRVPSASGGAFERAKAVIALDAALSQADPAATADAVKTLWDQAAPIGIITPLAQHFAPRLIEADVDPAAQDTLFKLLLLSDLYETAALDADLADTDPFLAALATGDPADALALRPAYPVLQEAFRAEADPILTDMATNGQLGEAILRTIATVQQGLDGDRIALRTGLGTLRALGLEDVARRTALQYAILP
ncbi:hypothetical protein [Pseudooctadecabacter sp.]|uniref:hypothetical protein n=1 Tax=Pseudooctadecabacter sp. TaxID=1966338 RepID=UPI0035C82F1D